VTDKRKTWRVTGVKRTRTHSINLLADTADEAIGIAKGRFRFSQVSSCVEHLPVQLPGGSVYLGWLPANDPLYENAGWNFLIGKNLNPHLR
jgi:hypothetical protein